MRCRSAPGGVRPRLPPIGRTPGRLPVPWRTCTRHHPRRSPAPSCSTSSWPARSPSWPGCSARSARSTRTGGIRRIRCRGGACSSRSPPAPRSSSGGADRSPPPASSSSSPSATRCWPGPSRPTRSAPTPRPGAPRGRSPSGSR
ncbi:hypothetical protein B4N89_04715 [Embleya scabrispora]|uniref:Uncharacterized protein n=1 Tax=Embleya scabrispora TaxID=159449 RepID=A0A1T3NUH8_9ACTN|nr:hypothetical protein B4N89_04715 [Embleya scabrispora]